MGGQLRVFHHSPLSEINPIDEPAPRTRNSNSMLASSVKVGPIVERRCPDENLLLALDVRAVFLGRFHLDDMCFDPRGPLLEPLERFISFCTYFL
jgi:hypothetical protein